MFAAKSKPSAALSRAQQALHDSAFYALRSLCVEQVDEGLLISGAVSTFYQKQQAQEIVRAAANGTQVVNSVEVTATESPRDFDI